MSTGPGNPNPSNPSIHPAFAAIHDELVDEVTAALDSHPVMRAAKPLMGGVGFPSGLSIDPSGAVRFAEDLFAQYAGSALEQWVRDHAPMVKKWIADSVLALASRLITDVESHPVIMQARQDAAERGGEE
jgi:hypothetical protein